MLSLGRWSRRSGARSRAVRNDVIAVDVVVDIVDDVVTVVVVCVVDVVVFDEVVVVTLVVVVIVVAIIAVDMSSFILDIVSMFVCAAAVVVDCSRTDEGIFGRDDDDDDNEVIESLVFSLVFGA